MQELRSWAAGKAIRIGLAGVLGFSAFAQAGDYEGSPQVAEFVAEMTRDYGFAGEQLVSLFHDVERKQTILDAISRPAEKVKPLRVAGAPVSFECRLHSITRIGEGPAAANVVFGLIQLMHVDDAVLGADGKVDPVKLDLVARLGGEALGYFDGSVRVTRGGKNVRELGAGDFIGEIALVSDVPRTATVTATSPVRLLVITDRAFRGLIEQMPSIATKVLQSLGQRLHADAV